MRPQPEVAGPRPVRPSLLSPRHTVLVLILVATAGLLAGCGSGQSRSPSRSDAADVSVIRGWARALQAGHVGAAAAYFALPSVFANGVGGNGGLSAVVVHTEREARVVNESLSCGAEVISVTPHGRYLTATFRLTNRLGPGADCGSGTGQSAATDFVIRDGHIVDWIRAPAASGGALPKVPTVPAAPPSPSEQV